MVLPILHVLCRMFPHLLQLLMFCYIRRFESIGLLNLWFHSDRAYGVVGCYWLYQRISRTRGLVGLSAFHSLRDRPFNLQKGLWVFFVQNFFFSDSTRVSKARIFFQEFNIRLYDKNSESDYFFFLHQNQNIFSATLGIRIFFLEPPSPTSS